MSLSELLEVIGKSRKEFAVFALGNNCSKTHVDWILDNVNADVVYIASDEVDIAENLGPHLVN